MRLKCSDGGCDDVSLRYKLVFQNDIGTFEFSIKSGNVIEKIDSLTKQNVGFETTSSNRNIGEKVEYQRIEPKTITIRGTLLGGSDDKRKQMMHVIAPLTEGKLIFNDTYELNVYVKASPDVERYARNAKFSVSFFAAYPLWLQNERTETTLTGILGRFSFPWNPSEPTPFMFSEYAEEGYVTVLNTGEAPAYWTVDFYAMDTVTKPKIYNMETGEYVRILKTMEMGEHITVSTEGDELTVSVTAPDGTVSDGFQYLDVESLPFKLAVGENYIKTSAEANTVAMRTSISYRQGYVGV